MGVEQSERDLSELQQRALEKRDPDRDISLDVACRWSPAGMSGEPVAEETLLRGFKTARYAPSSYNNQPWYFSYVLPEDPQWEEYLDIIVPENRKWAKNAGALIIQFSLNEFRISEDFYKQGNHSISHSFDSGAAAHAFAIEMSRAGLCCRAMEGYDMDAAREHFDVPDHYDLEYMFGVGHPDFEEMSEAEERRTHVSDRMPVEEFAERGTASFPR